MANISRQKRPATTATVPVTDENGRRLKVPEKAVQAWERRGWTRVSAPAARRSAGGKQGK